NLLNMNIGRHSAFAFKVVPDLLHPEYMTIGENCVIGYNTTILTHEFLVDEFRTGHVDIGNHTLIGTNETILSGVQIGDYVNVDAGTVVSRNNQNHTLAYGNPMQLKQ